MKLLDTLNKAYNSEAEQADKHTDVLSDAQHVEQLHRLHLHRVKSKQSSDADLGLSASLSDVELATLSDLDMQQSRLQMMWEHIVKQNLAVGESIENAGMTFEQFREW